MDESAESVEVVLVEVQEQPVLLLLFVGCDVLEQLQGAVQLELHLWLLDDLHHVAHLIRELAYNSLGVPMSLIVVVQLYVRHEEAVDLVEGNRV